MESEKSSDISSANIFLPRSFQKFLPFAFLPSGSIREIRVVRSHFSESDRSKPRDLNFSITSVCVLMRFQGFGLDYSKVTAVAILLSLVSRRSALKQTSAQNFEIGEGCRQFWVNFGCELFGGGLLKPQTNKAQKLSALRSQRYGCECECKF